MEKLHLGYERGYNGNRDMMSPESVNVMERRVQ